MRGRGYSPALQPSRITLPYARRSFLHFALRIALHIQRFHHTRDIVPEWM